MDRPKRFFEKHANWTILTGLALIVGGFLWALASAKSRESVFPGLGTAGAGLGLVVAGAYSLPREE